VALVELGVVLVAPLAIALPHVLPLHRVTPSTAATIWLSVLALRALMAIGGALFVFVYLPQTGLYSAVVEWCWHEALPMLSTHLGLSAHPLLHAAIVLPGLALAVSIVWLLFGLTRGWLLLRSRLRHAIGEGPLGSTVIEDDDIVVGVTGLGRGRIVVSRAALRAMDSDELQASLNHELGHMRRRHRPVLLLASLLAALGRLLPGTAAAEAGLRFSLERDADEYAVRATRDPLALASAICKAATGGRLTGATSLSGSSVTRRLDHLEGQVAPAGRRLERAMRIVAAVLLVATLALTASVPSWALAVPKSEHTLSATGDKCPHDSAGR
jgi:Zn-dependent protease with chaperone function